jgi:predicted transcriptional regulator
MKSKIKKEIHKMIDDLEDEEALMLVKEDIAVYAKKYEAELNEEQLNELNEALKEADQGETVSYEEYTKHIQEWKKKLSSQKDS